jgi:hypothetical protein
MLPALKKKSMHITVYMCNIFMQRTLTNTYTSFEGLLFGSCIIVTTKQEPGYVTPFVKKTFQS